MVIEGLERRTPPPGPLDPSSPRPVDDALAAVEFGLSSWVVLIGISVSSSSTTACCSAPLSGREKDSFTDTDVCVSLADTDDETEREPAFLGMSLSRKEEARRVREARQRRERMVLLERLQLLIGCFLGIARAQEETEREPAFLGMSLSRKEEALPMSDNIETLAKLIETGRQSTERSQPPRRLACLPGSS
jgi:hypothetical protein